MSDLARWLKDGLKRFAPSISGMLRAARFRRGLVSYSQEGEDRVLARFFEFSPVGFYVDVGAHDPFRFSNTYLFYKRGWRGINIDAMPGSMKAFDKYRQEDINIEVGIGTTNETMPFFIFNEPALNSFDESLSISRETEKYRILEKVQVQVIPLAEILHKHSTRLLGPSFLTVDVEGHDLNVLKSNDWENFRPEFVLVECIQTPLGLTHDPIYDYMLSQGYFFAAKTMNTVFFRSKNQ